MKILYIKVTNGYTESFTYQENILPGKFRSLGHEVHLVVTPRSCDNEGKRIIRNPQKYINEHGVIVHVLSKPNKYNFWGRYFDYFVDLPQTIDSINPEFIFVQGLQFAGIKYLVKFKKTHPNVKIVVDNHADFNNMPLNSIKHIFIQKILFKRWAKIIECVVDKFYGVSPSRVEYLEKVYCINKKKIGLIKQGGDEKVIKSIDKNYEKKIICKNLNISENSYIFVSGGGKIDFNKRIDELIEAIIELDNCHLILFGTFTEEVYQKCQIWLKNKNVHYIGRIEGQNVYKYFIVANMVIFPGTHSVLWDQAAACGVPLAIKRWNGMEYFDINGNCIYLDKGNSDEIKSLIHKFTKDKNFRDNIIKAASGEAMVAFSYNEIAKQILELR